MSKIDDLKVFDYSFKHIEQPDDLFELYNPDKVKELLDSRGVEVREKIFELIDILYGSGVDSGASSIGVNPITGVNGTNIQAVLSSLKSLLDEHEINKLNPHEVTAEQLGVYTKDVIDSKIRGGDTVIKYERFVVTAVDTVAKTFSYANEQGTIITKPLTYEGYQSFELKKGNYVIGQNRIKAIVDEDKIKTVVGGDLIEKSTTEIAIVQLLPVNSKVVIEYFERIGLTGEHSITHIIGGSDEIPGLVKISDTQPTSNQCIWIDRETANINNGTIKRYNTSSSKYEALYPKTKDSQTLSDLCYKRLNKDSEGAFTLIEARTISGVLKSKSELYGGTAPKYLKRKVTLYDEDGITSLGHTVFDRVYDVDGDLIDEIPNNSESTITI